MFLTAYDMVRSCYIVSHRATPNLPKWQCRVGYGTMGVFGAARFGQATEGDCLVNTWLGGRREGWMDLAMTLILSISIPPWSTHAGQQHCPLYHPAVEGPLLGFQELC